MPKRATGQLLRNADGLSARVRIVGHHPTRPSFPLAGSLSDAQAEARTEVLAGWARSMKAHAAPDEIAKLVTLGAAAKTEQAFADVAEAVEAIVSGKTRSTVAALAPTFGKWADKWTTGELHKLYPDHVRDKDHDRDKETVRLYLQPIAFTRLSDFTLDDAERVMKALPARLAARSRKGVAQCMRKVLSLAVYPGRFIAQNPIPREWMPKVPKSADKAKSYLYPEELAKLLGCKDVALERRIAYGVLAHEGLRASELERLKWRDVDLERGRVKLDTNKTADPRSWALDPSVTRALTWWKKRLGADDGDFVLGGLDLGLGARWLQGKSWHVKTGKPEERGDLRLAGVTRAELFERSSTRQPIRLHDMRAAFVTVSLANGKTETWVTDRTGHKSSQMVAKYTRGACTWSELALGPLPPMAESIPEFREATEAPAPIAQPTPAKPPPAKAAPRRRQRAAIGQQRSPFSDLNRRPALYESSRRIWTHRRCSTRRERPSFASARLPTQPRRATR
jgi:integrase